MSKKSLAELASEKENSEIQSLIEAEEILKTELLRLKNDIQKVLNIEIRLCFTWETGEENLDNGGSGWGKCSEGITLIDKNDDNIDIEIPDIFAERIENLLYDIDRDLNDIDPDHDFSVIV